MTYFSAGIMVISLFTQAPELVTANPRVHTIWRFYHQPTGLNAYFPVKFEAQAFTFGLNYHGLGFRVTGFDLYAWDLFDDFDQNHKFIGVIAPVYLQWLAVSSNRPKGDILPLVFQIYAGASFWGLEKSRLLDFGVGFQYYMFSLSAGFKSIKADSRNFFVGDDNTNFHDYPVSAGNVYVSLNLTPGMWTAMKTNTRSP